MKRILLGIELLIVGVHVAFAHMIDPEVVVNMPPPMMFLGLAGFSLGLGFLFNGIDLVCSGKKGVYQ